MALGAQARRGRGDGRRRRRQHRRAAAGRGAGQRDPRRRGDVPRDAADDRRTARPTPVEAKGKAEPVKVWEAVGARSRFGSRRRAEAADAARRPRARARPARRRARRARAASSRRSSSRSSACRASARAGSSPSCSRSSTRTRRSSPGARAARSRTASGVSFWALGEIVKAQAGILESDDAATAEEKLDADGRRRSRTTRPSGTGSRATRARSSGLEGARARRARGGVRRLAAASRGGWPSSGRSCSSSRTCTGPTTACSTSSTTSPTGRPTVPLLIVATARPELLDRRPGWGGGKRNAFTLSLGAAHATTRRRAPLQRLLDRACSTPTRSRRCCSAPRGNPLYAEEYARMLAERERRRPGAARDRAGPDRRADRRRSLREEKTLLQDASVIGKVFWPARSAGRRADEPTTLHALERKEFVRRDRRSSVAGETQYAFLHALVRDVAYGQIPRARAGREAPARGGVDRVARRRPHRGSRRDARPPLPRGALALRGGRAGHDGAPRAGAPRVRGGRTARALARRRRGGAQARARCARLDAGRRSGAPAPPAASPPTPGGSPAPTMPRSCSSRRSRPSSPRTIPDTRPRRPSS